MTSRKKYARNSPDWFKPLDEPLPPMRWGLLAPDEQIQRKVGTRRVMEDAKLAMLGVYYDVPAGDFRALALALAREHVIGFSEDTPRGNKQKWHDYQLGVLYVEIERVRNQTKPRGTIKDAAAKLAAETRWSLFLKRYEGDRNKSDPADALRGKYCKAKRTKFARLFVDYFRLLRDENRLDEWEALVGDAVRNPQPDVNQ